MQEQVLAEILNWSAGQPLWQRDALRRIFSAGFLSAEDLDELTELAKAKHGLATARQGDPLERSHLGIGETNSVPVTLVSVIHHQGVNALAPDQTITFGPALTIVYGQNAAGKSGYTRILKQACRSRAREDVLGNVLADGAPPKGKASLHFKTAEDEHIVSWSSDGVPATALTAVSVFDAQCAPVYLRDRTDVAFRPFGLDVFDKLASACAALRKRLEAEQKAISTPLLLPQIPAGSKVAGLLSSLTGLTNTELIRDLATLSPGETTQLDALRTKQRDLHAADPKKRAHELDLKAGRIESLIAHLTRIADKLDDGGVEELRKSEADLEAANKALAHLRTTAVTPDLLTGTGEYAWRRMWDSSGDFSSVAYPSEGFPVTRLDAKCPLCQQPISNQAAERFKHFRELVTSSAQADVRTAERRLEQQVESLNRLAVGSMEVALALDEIRADNATLADQLAVFQSDSTALQATILHALHEGRPLPARGVTRFPEADLRAMAQWLREHATQLRDQNPTMDPMEAQELLELETRITLQKSVDEVLGEIERLKRVAAYGQCISETNTLNITRKSTELTTRLVTQRLQDAFSSEIHKVEFTHLAVELKAAGGAKGALFHQLVFSNAPGTPVSRVLSEGESRALSLAAFLSELSTATTASAIIFDDPVSSLDHIWCERIARRLVAEAKIRQVIVFTHDLVFLKCLLSECYKQSVTYAHQYVRRDGDVSGLCSEDLPWFAMGVKDRIAVLRNRWQSAEKLSRTQGVEAYEREARELYGMLREAWEQAVGEVLLNDVIEPYRPGIETKKIRHLHDISKEECVAVEDAITECSRWLRGHHQAPADGTPFPTPAELAKRINDLDEWVKLIRKRRDGKKNRPASD